MMERKSFLDQEAPEGYIAGVGRGATGFSTSAETGIARSLRELEIDNHDSDDDENENRNIEDEKGILASLGLSKEDEEADRIYEEVDKRMQLRNKSRNELVSLDLDVGNSTSIKEQFADLKRGLSVVSQEEWANIPEVGDLTKRNKRARILQQQQQRFYAVPDSIIAGAGSGGIGNLDNKKTDFKVISDAKDKMLGKQLDSLMPTSVNEGSQSEEMVTLLGNENESQIQMNDISKGRLILASLRKTEPHKASSWIASARLEEQAKKINAAKNLITEGCRRVPRNEDIWLENIRIHKKSSESNKMCKLIVADALKMIPKSEKLWITAVELENSSDIMSKRRVLMRALESLPNSVNIWKELVNLEDEKEDVKRMLQKATELCPQEWDFWLTLINLSEYKEAKTLLNKARKILKYNHKVWITALKLEERENESTTVLKLTSMLEKGLSELAKNILDDSKLVQREDWLQEAQLAENEGFLKTCEAIVVNTLKSDLDGNDDTSVLDLWFNDVRNISLSGSLKTVNFIYHYIIDMYPNNTNVWIKLITFIKENRDVDTSTEIFELYSKAVERNPESSLLALMYAKDLWKLAEDIQLARKVLLDACLRMPSNEEIWLARIKLEIKTSHYELANKISWQAIKDIGESTPRIWYKHVQLQRYLQRTTPSETYENDILNLLNDALDKYPENEKLYLQKSAVLIDDLRKFELAREVYSIGVKKCKHSGAIWISWSRFEEFTMKFLVRARSILDNALLSNQDNDELWNERIDLEKRNNNTIAASQLVNKAIKQLPNSLLLWIQKLSLFTKPSLRKNAFVDALKQTENSPVILLQIGIYFMLDGKISRAKSWIDRAYQADKTNGDIWGWLFQFINKFGTEEEKRTVLEEYQKVFDDIKNGRVWNSVQKDVQNFDKSEEEILEIVSKKLIVSNT